MHEECSICIDNQHDPGVTTCGHSFGHARIAEVIDRQHKRPTCRAAPKDESVLVPPAYEGGDEMADNEMGLTQSSSKLENLVNIIGSTKAKADKTVIFSQWTRFIDIVHACLDCDGCSYGRLDATMNAQRRWNCWNVTRNAP